MFFPLEIQDLLTNISADILEAAIWSLVETNVGFFCACVPTLKPLLVKLSPNLIAEKVHLPTRRRGNGYTARMLGPEIALSSRLQSHRAYAQFDVEGQLTQVVKPGKVKVTTLVVQDVETDIEDSEGSAKELGLA
jgi:hypothetical protein